MSRLVKTDIAETLRKNENVLLLKIIQYVVFFLALLETPHGYYNFIVRRHKYLTPQGLTTLIFIGLSRLFCGLSPHILRIYAP